MNSGKSNHPWGMTLSMGIKDSSITEILKKIRGLDIELPALEPNEPVATPEQIEEIVKLTDHILPDEKIVVLGKWQAAQIIFKLKEAEILCFLAADEEEAKSKHKFLKVVIALSVFIFLALLIVSYIIKKH
jgi:hypothetical protein